MMLTITIQLEVENESEARSVTNRIRSSIPRKDNDVAVFVSNINARITRHYSQKSDELEL